MTPTGTPEAPTVAATRPFWLNPSGVPRRHPDAMHLTPGRRVIIPADHAPGDRPTFGMLLACEGVPGAPTVAVIEAPRTAAPIRVPAASVWHP